MTILLLAQDSDVATRCRRAVSAEHPFEVAEDVPALLSRVQAAPPAVILLDARTLAPPIEKQAGEIVAASGTARVIVLTEAFHEDEEIALLKAGVKGVCRRGIDPDSLQRVINVTQTGGVWVTRTLLPRLVTELRRAAAMQRAPIPHPSPAVAKAAAGKLESLSSREREIVRLIVAGASNKEVAAALSISERTVKGHLSNVFQKLGVSDRMKLALFVRGAA